MELQHCEYWDRQTHQCTKYCNIVRIEGATCNNNIPNTAIPNNTRSPGKNTNSTPQSSKFLYEYFGCNIDVPSLSSAPSTSTQARWFVTTRRDNAKALDAQKALKHKIFIKEVNIIENQGKDSLLTLWTPHEALLFSKTGKMPLNSSRTSSLRSTIQPLQKK